MLIWSGIWIESSVDERGSCNAADRSRDHTPKGLSFSAPNVAPYAVAESRLSIAKVADVWER